MRAWIGLGGNVGEVRESMRGALGALQDGGDAIEAVSPLYETPPWGVVDQPRFLNACVELRTDREPKALLDRLHAIERGLRRVRTKRWGPRTIDLDLLVYEGFARAEPGLHVPHPRIAERAFVLVPLADIAPTLEIDGQPVSERARAADAGGMVRVDGSWAQDLVRSSPTTGT